MLLMLLQRLLFRLLRGVVSRLGPAHQVQHLDLGDLVGVSGVCLPERDEKQKSFLIFPFFWRKIVYLVACLCLSSASDDFTIIRSLTFLRSRQDVSERTVFSRGRT